MTTSKYFNLDKHGPNWTKEEFSKVVLTIEKLKRKELKELAEEFKLEFENKDISEIDDENIIYALIDDIPKEKLLKKIETLGQ